MLLVVHALLLGGCHTSSWRRRQGHREAGWTWKADRNVSLTVRFLLCSAGHTPPHTGTAAEKDTLAEHTNSLGTQGLNSVFNDTATVSTGVPCFSTKLLQLATAE